MRRSFSKLFLPVLLTSIFLASCEKEIDLNVQGEGTKLVVQASIEREVDPTTGDEQGIPPIIALTKSISFFGDVDSSKLSEIFVHDAEVFISDGTREIKLKEYDFRFAPGQSLETAYFYSLDTSDPSAYMLGEFGKTYNLRIEWQGQTYTSTTSISRPVQVDSIWQQNANVPLSDTTFQEIRAQYTDPPQSGQNYYYRVFSYFPDGGGRDYDDYFNDEVANDVSIKFSFYSNDEDNEINRYGYWLPGDSAMIRWSSIDYAAYEFLNTMNFSEGSIGNPFGTPVNVLGNISNGALGAFIGYGTYTYTYQVK